MDANRDIEKWKWLSYLQSLFALETFIAPVLVIFYTQYAGFTFAQYAMLMSCIFVLSWAFQLPTGAIADKYGAKRALIAGNLIYISAMLSLVVFGTRTPMLLTATMFSLGGALSTGAFQSMMFSVFASANREREFNAVCARSNGFALLGGAAGAALGGWFASVSLALPMIVDIVVLSVTTIALGILINAPTAEPNVRQVSLNAIALDACKAAFESPKLFVSILVSAVAFAGVRTGFNLYQPLLMSAGLSLRELGLVFGAFSLLSAVFAYAYSKVSSRVDGPVVLVVIALIFAASAAVLTEFMAVPGIICAILCHQLVRAVYPSLSAYMINMNIAAGSKSRTTILSLAALLRSMTAALFSYGLAQASGFTSDKAMFGVVSLVSAVLILALGLWSVYAARSKDSAPASSGG